ncbi:MAG TPA: hypothetical protein VK909_08465, partial [Anaerolineales bacterium]|nr:hypothetical protein [Anaerolineales bacterium]
LVFVGFIVYAYTGHKLGGGKWAITAILISPPVIHNTINGNIDWLPLLGLTLPPQLGLFSVTMKPQLGVASVLFWLVETWRISGYRETIKVFLPITLATVLSLFFYGFWPLRAAVEVDLWWNTSLWPFSLPVGLALMVAAYHRRDIRYAMGASPCFSPYILFIPG